MNPIDEYKNLPINEYITVHDGKKTFTARIDDLEVGVSSSGRRYVSLNGNTEKMSFSELNIQIKEEESAYNKNINLCNSKTKDLMEQKLINLKTKVSDLRKTAFGFEATQNRNLEASEPLITARERINEKFDQLGLVDSDYTALLIAALMSKKNRPNSIFIIKDENIGMLTASIENLVKKNTATDLIKFQIIHFTDSHVSFGEFQIDKTTTPNTVRYLHCDPAPPCNPLS